MRSSCHFSDALKALVVAIAMVVVAGCSIAPAESVTLQTDLPPNFSLHGTASYTPATGETCTVPPRQGRNVPGRKFFDQELQEQAQTASFQVPLTDKAGGCPLVLSRFEFALEGKFGPRPIDIGKDYAGISFKDKASTSSTYSSSSAPQTFNGQCQWFFRTIGPKRYIVKILKCRAIDETGKVLDGAAGGTLLRDQLAGKTVKMTFTIANEEKPFYKGWWVETPKGWKPCTGLWGTPNEELCTEPYKFIKSFKMLDGRDCSVYPSCIE